MQYQYQYEYSYPSNPCSYPDEDDDYTNVKYFRIVESPRNTNRNRNSNSNNGTSTSCFFGNNDPTQHSHNHNHNNDMLLAFHSSLLCFKIALCVLL